MSPSRYQRRADRPWEASGPEWWKGPEWRSERFRQAGWVLLPLRLFLGVTFTYASLQKLGSRQFFDSGSPLSVQHQMQSLAPTSPIGPLVQLSLHAGAVVGLAIAVGELAVGLGTLLGLKARLAAAGGAVLALSFFLTVSWNTSPYYYGADIVFLFAWTPFIAIGAGGVMSVDGWVADRPAPLDRDRATSPRGTARERERRALLTTGLLAALLGGFTALFPRLPAGGAPRARSIADDPSNRPARTGSSASAPATSSSPGAGRPRAPAGMTQVSAANALQVGGAGQFRDPATGNPAWLVRTGQRSFVAFSAVCTHAGCTVNYDSSSQEFVCPCHGGTYSAKSGQVLGGPPPAPLGRIPLRVADGQIYVR